MAIDRAVRDVIPVAVESSARAAVNTTRNVVLKDFAVEANESTLRKGAHLMVKQMAGSLALVQHKEALRVGMEKVIRRLLEAGHASPDAIEQTVQTCISNNFELACALVERAVVERAVRDLDAVLSSAYQARRQARDASVPYVLSEAAQAVDLHGALKSPFPLPDALKHSGQGLLPNQHAVYEDFKSVRSFNDPNKGSSANGPGGESKMAIAETTGAALSGAHATEAYRVILARIEQSLTQVRGKTYGRELTLSMLAGDHEIMSLLRDAVIVTQRTQPAVRIDSALGFAEIVFKSLVGAHQTQQVPDPLRMDVLVGCIEALRDACGGPKKFQPNMSEWLSRYVIFRAGEEWARKGYLIALVRLIRAKLLRPVDIDHYMAAQMDSGQNLLWVEFALALVRQCLVDGIAVTQDFATVFDAVSKIRPANPAIRKQLHVWLTDLRTVAANKGEKRGIDAGNKRNRRTCRHSS